MRIPSPLFRGEQRKKKAGSVFKMAACRIGGRPACLHHNARDLRSRPFYKCFCQVWGGGVLWSSGEGLDRAATSLDNPPSRRGRGRLPETGTCLLVWRDKGMHQRGREKKSFTALIGPYGTTFTHTRPSTSLSAAWERPLATRRPVVVQGRWGWGWVGCFRVLQGAPGCYRVLVGAKL